MEGLSLGRAVLAEFVGTFALVLSISLTLAGGATDPLAVPIAVGLTVTVFIYAVGPICGAHFNPAVSIAFWAAGRFKATWVGPYFVGQFAGATLASLAAGLIAIDAYSVPGGFKSEFAVTEALMPLLGVARPSTGVAGAIACEVVLTFFLVLVILRVSTGAKEVGTMAGIAVGGTVTLTAIVGGPISGAALNPARAFGPAVAVGHFADFWVYVVGPIAGALSAVAVDRMMGPYPSLAAPAMDPE